MSKATIELCIALIPSGQSLKLLDGLLEAVEKPQDSRVTLRLESKEGGVKLATCAHLTLYQVALRCEDLDEAIRALEEEVVAKRTSVLEDGDPPKKRRLSGPIDVPSDGSSVACSTEEGSCELKWRSSDVPTIVALQQATVKELNALRGNLQITHDPAGRDIQEMINSSNGAYPGVDIDNLREYGFAEGTNKFNPHITLGWFDLCKDPFEDGTFLSSLSSLWSQKGNTIRFERLGVFALGPYGSCPQLIHAIDL